MPNSDALQQFFGRAMLQGSVSSGDSGDLAGSIQRGGTLESEGSRGGPTSLASSARNPSQPPLPHVPPEIFEPSEDVIRQLGEMGFER